MPKKQIHALLLIALLPLLSFAADEPKPVNKPKPEDTEVWQPEPKVITPGATPTTAPSDAIILFDGKNLDEWVSAQDRSAPAAGGPAFEFAQATATMGAPSFAHVAKGGYRTANSELFWLKGLKRAG